MNKGAGHGLRLILAPHKLEARLQAEGHGWPIATGVIEGACRHLIKDRMDLTGTRWGLPGAESVLKLRALQQRRLQRLLGLPPQPRTTPNT